MQLFHQLIDVVGILPKKDEIGKVGLQKLAVDVFNVFVVNFRTASETILLSKTKHVVVNAYLDSFIYLELSVLGSASISLALEPKPVKHLLETYHAKIQIDILVDSRKHQPELT